MYYVKYPKYKSRKSESDKFVTRYFLVTKEEEAPNGTISRYLKKATKQEVINSGLEIVTDTTPFYS